MKLHNTPVTPRMFKYVIIDIDSSKAYSPDRTSVVFLMNHDSECSKFSLIFSIRIWNLVFYGCKVLSMVPVLKKVGERFVATNYLPVSFLFVII